MKDINETIASLRLLNAVESYPRLQDLQYFRKLNDFIENTFNENLQAINGRNIGGLLTLQMLHERSEEKKYKSFQYLVRPSLLITLCAFIEDVFTNRINSDVKLKNDFDNLPKEKLSNINKARKFLANNGYEKLNNIKGIAYVNNMYWIRNSFVHNKGEALKGMEKLQKKYNFKIEKNKIMLGEKFIENYIAHLEKFAVEVAEIIYENESRAYKFLKDNPQFEGTADKFIKLSKSLDLNEFRELIELSRTELHR